MEVVEFKGINDNFIIELLFVKKFNEKFLERISILENEVLEFEKKCDMGKRECMKL